MSLKIEESTSEINLDGTITVCIPINIRRKSGRRFIMAPGNVELEFIAKAGFVDTTAKMLKTESAEKEHQEMLRDIAAFLLSAGHAPLQSSSIDLLVESATGDNMFEIKSANAVNIIHQAAKGVFQLISYAIALEEEGRTLKSNALILGCSGNVKLNAFVDSVVKKAGLQCLFYKKSEAWPNRIPGLLDLLVTRTP